MFRDLQDFWHFSRRYKQFKRVSSLSLGLLDKDHQISEEAQNALKKLNSDRIACHNKIAGLDLPSAANCGICNGACCNEPSNHYFTAIDFWLRKSPPDKVHTFAQDPPKPLRHYYKIGIKSAWDRVTLSPKMERAAQTGPPETRCAHHGANGCQLPHVERPVKCLIYACPGMKKSMNEATRLTYMEAVKELHQISLQTFNVLKVEAGLPPYYGLASLMLTL